MLLAQVKSPSIIVDTLPYYFDNAEVVIDHEHLYHPDLSGFVVKQTSFYMVALDLSFIAGNLGNAGHAPFTGVVYAFVKLPEGGGPVHDRVFKDYDLAGFDPHNNLTMAAVVHAKTGDLIKIGVGVHSENPYPFVVQSAHISLVKLA